MTSKIDPVANGPRRGDAGMVPEPSRLRVKYRCYRCQRTDALKPGTLCPACFFESPKRPRYPARPLFVGPNGEPRHVKASIYRPEWAKGSVG